MKYRTGILIQLGILLASLAISAFYNFRLPEHVPTHWNIHNQADQYGSKWQMVLLGPGMVLFAIGLTLLLPKISPKNYEIDRFNGTFAYAMVLVTSLFLLISILFLRAAEGVKIDFIKVMMSVMFMFFALLGNVIGKVRRNFYMGIRTPWTLASEAVWDATHRQAGYIWFIGGIFGTALVLLGLPLLWSMALFMAVVLWPVVHSYSIYRKLEG